MPAVARACRTSTTDRSLGEDVRSDRRCVAQTIDNRTPVAKSPSGGGLPGLERDGVSERFELSDQAFGEPLGVLADEVVAAEVAVELSGLEHVPGGGEDRVADRG